MLGRVLLAAFGCWITWLASAGNVALADLRAFSVDEIGVSSAEGSSLGPDLWRGTRREVVDELLARVPLHTTSPAINDLFRRLLLAPARPPEGEHLSGSLLARRAALLLATGHFEDVRELLDTVPARLMIRELTPVEVDSRFLAGDTPGGCGVVGRRIDLDPNVALQKAWIFCQALAGAPEPAELGLALLVESGDTDADFASLMAALAGHGPIAFAPAQLTPLTWAMTEAAGVPVPRAAAESNSPGVLRAIATSPHSAADLRLAAAEKAHAANAIAAETLRQVYHRLEFPENALIEPGAGLGQTDSPKRLALYYLASLVEGSPNQQVRIIAAALQAAREAGRYPATATVYAEILGNMLPSAELLPFAAEAVRALLVAGAEEAAGAWRTLVEQERHTSSAAAAAQIALLPLDLAVAADAGEGLARERLAEWWQKQAETADLAAQASLILRMLEALGLTIPPDLLHPTPAERSAAASEAQVRLEQSAAAGRIGEVVLRAVLLLGDSPSSTADASNLYSVIHGLRAVGLGAEARALAIETIAAAGR
jgi:hypothetical protein